MTKQRIIEEAFHIFALKGYDGTSLSEIAEKVGIKKPSIYVHFKSKEDLFLKILDLEVEKFMSHINNAMSGLEKKSPEEQLSKFGEACIDYEKKYKYTNSFWTGAMFFPQINISEEISNMTSKIINTCLEIVRNIMKTGISMGHIIERPLEELVYSYLALLQGVFILIFQDDSQSPEIIEQFFKIYWRGISR
jgi:AcrR family transcriptional regulator